MKTVYLITNKIGTRASVFGLNNDRYNSKEEAQSKANDWNYQQGCEKWIVNEAQENN